MTETLSETFKLPIQGQGPVNPKPPPPPPPTEFQKAHMFLQMGRVDEAETICKEVLEKDKNDKDVKELYALILSSKHKYEDAKVLYEEILVKYPKDANANNNLGIIYSRLDDQETSMKYFSKALKSNPEDINTLLNLGAIYRKKRQFKKAEDSFKKIIKLDKENANAHSYLAKTYEDQGHVEKATTLYKKALKINPKDTRAISSLGLLSRRKGNIKKAIEYFEQVVEINPKDYLALHNLGVFYKIEDEYNKALTVFKQVLELNPNDEVAKFEIATLTNGDKPKAPPQYMQRLFNQYAFSFDKELQENLEYSVPKLFGDYFKTNFADRKFESALDLGCGTGLCGDELKLYVQTLTGLDIAQNMIEQAREKKVYDDLLVDDIEVYLDKNKQKYDLFIAGDTIVYYGKLGKLLKLISNRANDDAVFIFSAEYGTAADDYQLQKSGRYQHNPGYIVQLAIDNGFIVEHFKEENLRKEKKKWVKGNIYVLRFSPEITEEAVLLEKSTADIWFYAMINGCKERDINLIEKMTSFKDIENCYRRVDDCNRSILHYALINKFSKKAPNVIAELVQAGAIVSNGNEHIPYHVPKLITKYANAENISKIIERLYDLDNDLDVPEGLVCEVGSGEGYLSYLMSLMNKQKHVQSFKNKLVETESSLDYCDNNQEVGKYVLQGEIAELSAYFSENSFSKILSLNVLDIFSKEDLEVNLRAIKKLLKSGGLIVHIVSSCIHINVFRDIMKHNTDQMFFPYYDNGDVGVLMVNKAEFMRSGIEISEQKAEDLCLCYENNPGDYKNMYLAAKEGMDEQDLIYETILLKDYFIQKLHATFKAVGIDRVLEEDIISEVEVKKTADHEELGEVNMVHNKLGTIIALLNDQKYKDILEKATFSLIVGRVPAE